MLSRTTFASYSARRSIHNTDLHSCSSAMFIGHVAHAMEEDMILKREECELRRLTREDAPQILHWRNQKRIRENMYTDHIITFEEHMDWIERALHDPCGHYLIFMWRGRMAGFVSITNVDKLQSRASWAFYLGETDLPKGSGVAMEYLALEYAFETIGLRKLSCEVFSFNTTVIKLHDRFGFQQEALYKDHALKNGKFVDVVGLAMFQNAWLENKNRMYSLGFSS